MSKFEVTLWVLAVMSGAGCIVFVLPPAPSWGVATATKTCMVHQFAQQGDTLYYEVRRWGAAACVVPDSGR